MSIEAAQVREVYADEAEGRGFWAGARAEARMAGSLYEAEAKRAEGVSLFRAAQLYRMAQRCYARGRSTGRAFRMGVRAERCEREESERVQRDATWIADKAQR